MANIEMWPLPESAVMGAAMSMEEEKPAMFCFRQKKNGKGTSSPSSLLEVLCVLEMHKISNEI